MQYIIVFLSLEFNKLQTFFTSFASVPVTTLLNGLKTCSAGGSCIGAFTVAPWHPRILPMIAVLVVVGTSVPMTMGGSGSNIMLTCFTKPPVGGFFGEYPLVESGSNLEKLIKQSTKGPKLSKRLLSA